MGWSAPTPRIDDSDTFGDSTFTLTAAGLSPGYPSGGRARGSSAREIAAAEGRAQALDVQNTRLADRVDELEDTLHGQTIRAAQAEARAGRAEARARQAEGSVESLRKSHEEQLASLQREVEHLRAGATEAELDAADLSLSEGAAEELRRRPKDSLSLRERMCLRLKEATAPLRRELETVRRELDQARETLGGQASASDRQQREAVRRARAAETACEDAEGRARDAEERAERLRDRVRGLEQRCDQLQGKGDAFDAAEAERISLQRRVDEMSHALGAAEENVNDLQDQRERLRAELGDYKAKDEALAAERTRWQRQAEDADRELRRVSARAQELEARLSQAEAGREQARDALQRERDERSASESLKLEAELQRLREEAAVELAKVRGEAEELRARESRHAQGRIDDQSVQIRALQERLDASESSRRHTSKQLEEDLRSMQEQLAQAKADCRVKSFELEKCNAALGEAQEGRAAAEERGEILRRQLDVARGEL